MFIEMLRAANAGVATWIRRQTRAGLLSRSQSTDSDHLVVELLKKKHQGERSCRAV